MTFIKLGEAQEIKLENVDSCLASVNPDILENFRKFATDLKKIAPKADDFLYFSAVMLHAAEAVAINDDGTPKLTIKGEPLQVGWDRRGDTWRWTSNDPNIKPYKNCNGDIFPESELVKAHKKWVGKPLCIDHKSSSVDHTRGFIVDTYYDRSLKRVIALCALDKANYPDLARKVSTGMQTNVSMGTAVGQAICSDCATVARTEQDFCDHMKRKSCYGEINIDLNPLELSIVVTGADPKANIKHIIAAANTLNIYVENKQKELNKLADEFTCNLNFNKTDGGPDKLSTNFNLSSNDLAQFKSDVADAMKKLENLQFSTSKEKTESSGNDSAFDKTVDSPEADSGLASPHERLASNNINIDLISELQSVTKAIETKLAQMKISLDKLGNASINKQEENMSGTNIKQAYYQGGGGVNEPTPGQAKYPKDPLNEDLRERDDKQMHGQSPFPGVGSVDGMHPSPDSAEQPNELERKKMLARAEAEERAIRRQAIVNLAKQTLENKQAYFQGGGGVNEPAKPGTVKYPADKLERTLREREDKQMVGQKPFPGVGPVDGVHPSPSSVDPSDELKRKEMLRRASLRAKFIKAANWDGTTDLAGSAWEVYLGDRLILTASVDELSGGRSDLMHDSIATKEFGSKLLEKIKAHGVDRVRSLVKKGQGAPAAPAMPQSGMPPADLTAPQAPPGDVGLQMGEGLSDDTGKSGDPKETAVDLAEKVRDLSSDLVEAVRALTGEKAEMGLEGEKGSSAPPAPPGMGAAASFSTETLNTLRKELNVTLTQAMKEAVANLNDHAEELDMISGLYNRGQVSSSNQDLVGTIVDDAFNEAKTAIADGFKLMTAFVKYARGTKAIVKRAQIEAELGSLSNGDDTMSAHDRNLADMVDDVDADLGNVADALNSHDDDDESGEDVYDVGERESGDEDLDLDLDKPDLDLNDPDVRHGFGESGADELWPSDKDEEDEEDEDLDDEDFEVDVDDNDLQLKDDKGNVVADNLKLASPGFNSKSARAALRARLAADATGKQDDGSVKDMAHASFSDMLDQADKHADGKVDFDTKPSDNLGVFETLEETNNAMMDLAKAPPKVRKEAEAIHRLISEGKLDPADLDALVAEGLDKDAVSYYKKYWGQADGGSEFASELVKEHVKAQLEEELNKYRVKLARSYELAYDMVDRGLCHSDRGAVSDQVDEIMKFNDESFESLKRVVARHEPTLRKTAGRLPQVGVIGSEEVNSVSNHADDDWSQLSAAFSKTSKRMF